MSFLKVYGLVLVTLVLVGLAIVSFLAVSAWSPLLSVPYGIALFAIPLSLFIWAFER